MNVGCSSAVKPLLAPLPGEYKPPIKKKSRWYQPDLEHYPSNSRDDYPPSYGAYKGEGEHHPGSHYDPSSDKEPPSGEYDAPSGPYEKPYGDAPFEPEGTKYPAGDSEPYKSPYAKKGAEAPHTKEDYSAPTDEDQWFSKGYDKEDDKPTNHGEESDKEPEPDNGDQPGTEYETEGQPPSDSYSNDSDEEVADKETKKEEPKVGEETMEQLMAKYKALQQEKLYLSIKQEYESMRSMYNDLMKTLDDLKGPTKDGANKTDGISKDMYKKDSKAESKDSSYDNEEKPFFGGSRHVENVKPDYPSKDKPAPPKPSDYAPSDGPASKPYPPGENVTYPVYEPAPESSNERVLHEGAAMCDADFKPLHSKKVYGNVCLKEVNRDLTAGTTRMPQHLE
jgi:hypothetical protein